MLYYYNTYILWFMKCSTLFEHYIDAFLLLLCTNIIYTLLTYKVNCVFVQLCLPFLYAPELLGQFVIRLVLCDEMFHLEMTMKFGHFGVNGRCTFYVFVNRQEVYAIDVHPPFTRIDNCSHCCYICMFIDQYMQTMEAVYKIYTKLLHVQHLLPVYIFI